MTTTLQETPATIRLDGRKCHCGKEFTPKRKNQVHCSAKCKHEKWNKEHWKKYTAEDGSILIVIIK